MRRLRHETYARELGQHAVRVDGELPDALDGVSTYPGVADFLLVHLPASAPTAATVVARCRRDGVHLRDASGTGRDVGDRDVRIAVRSADDDGRVLRVLRSALTG